MRIEYSGKIEKQSELDPFISMRKAERHAEIKYDGFGATAYESKVYYVQDLVYDLDGIQILMTDTLESRLKSNGVKAFKTDRNKLWCKDPYKFSARLYARIDDHDDNVVSSESDMNHIGEIEDVKKGYIFTSRKLVSVYTPKIVPVTIFGDIAFEDLDVDPANVLKALADSNYVANMITTPEEIRKIINKLRSNKKSSDDSVIRRDDNGNIDNGLLGLGIFGIFG